MTAQDALLHVIARIKSEPSRTWSIIITLYGDSVVPRGGSLWLGSTPAPSIRSHVAGGPRPSSQSGTTTQAAFAAGSGITPILSIIRHTLARERSSRFFLFYGNRTSRDIMFKADLEALKDRYMGRLSIFHVLSREAQDIAIMNGHLDGVKARILLETVVSAPIVDDIFICGPDSMMDDIDVTCRDLGISAALIHTERFVSASNGVGLSRRPAAQSAEGHAIATFVIDGKRRDVPVMETESLLDAALRAGMDLPFACKGGMCSTCRAKITEGDAVMDLNYSLEPWELEKGFVLTCQSHPKSPRLTIDVDQI